MKTLTASDALTLSISERIQLVEDIWDTIAAEAESVGLSEAEKVIIDERLNAYHRNPSLGLPWDDVKKKITNRSDGSRKTMNEAENKGACHVASS